MPAVLLCVIFPWRRLWCFGVHDIETTLLRVELCLSGERTAWHNAGGEGGVPRQLALPCLQVFGSELFKVQSERDADSHER